MNNVEMWRPVFGYEGIYEVSNIGNVRSLDRQVLSGDRTINRKGKQLKHIEDKHGYVYVCLAKEGIQHQRFIHVLVAEAFLSKPEIKVEVNHKDGDKRNNTVDNLEWVTHEENIAHSFRTGLHKIHSREFMSEISKIGNAVSVARSSRPVICETDNIAFASQNAADRYYGYHAGTVNECLKKQSKTFKGRKFRELAEHEKNDYTLLS